MTVISTYADYKNALRQTVRVDLPPQLSTGPTGAFWATLWKQNGGAMDPASTTTGVVPTLATTGAIQFQAFTGPGYITRIRHASNAPPASTTGKRWLLFDRLFAIGRFAASASDYTFSGQPSFASRLPTDASGNPIYHGLLLAQETSVVNGQSLMTITYTNQSGVSGRSISHLNSDGGSANDGEFVRWPLQSGDDGIMSIDSLHFPTGGDLGHEVFLIVRPLALGRGAGIVNFYDPVTYGIEALGMPRIFADSCLEIATLHDDNTKNAVQTYLDIEIAS